MRVLVACECSGVVRRAFREAGHDAWSCDLKPADDGSPCHLQGDALALLREGWDMLIAHPPCDYLATCAAWAFCDPDYARWPGVGYHQKVQPGTLTGAARRAARVEAERFFLALWEWGIERICIENPVGCMGKHPALPRKLPGRQTIQPHQFGEDASKATCLWLRGLPPLVPTGNFPPRWVEHNGKLVPRWSNQTDSGQNRLPPSQNRAAVRAVTYPGIAAAMALQWGQSQNLSLV